MASGSKLAGLIRDVPDFPKKGILFKDITPLLLDPAALRDAVEALSSSAAGRSPALVAGIESRGFIFGSAVATRLGAGFVPVRKPGKLPAKTASETYQLEYGTDTLEIHEDAIRPGDEVLLVDDLLATGGTAAAAVRLIRRLGGRIIGVSFLIELEFLGGRARLEGLPVTSLIRYS